MRVDRVLGIRGLTAVLLFLSTGCGGGGSTAPPPPAPSFLLSVSPSSLLVAQTTTSAPITVTAVPNNGFTNSVTVTITGLPTGVTSSPNATFTLAASSSQMVTFTVGPSVGRANYLVTFSGSSGSLPSSAAVTLTVSGAPLTATTGNFKQQVIYQIVTDRFFDGDPTNNDPPQSKGLFDATKTNWQMYWGGDLAGIQQKMAYLAGMGITAIWISPPADNINVGTPNAPYHGYWARDMQRIEEHFGDASNSWAAFDSMATAAHENGIRVIVDFAPNHTNPNDAGEFGAIFDTGQPFASYLSDPAPPNNFFHHNPTIANFNDPYQLQYYTLVDLADLNQEQAQVDSYLKRAVLQFMQHGADGFRFDAVKHVTWGWEYTLANAAFTAGPVFLYGEWFQGATNDPTYPDSVKFSNRSGIALIDFPLAFAMQDVFGNNGDFHEIDNTISQENNDFSSPNDLVTFFDNHDIPRLLSVNNSQNRLNEALALLLACRGIPVILYGDEQYLHNDTSGGKDPYNRLWMSSFDTGTTAYKLINRMANLRQANPALAYGTSQQRWINSDVYILERQFFENVLLIAVNKSETAAYNISGLFTALSPGPYPDYLNGLMGGFSIQVNLGAGGNDPVTVFSLPPHTVSVWQSSGPVAAPELGSVGPRVAQGGLTATVAGKGFGSSPGAILVGSTPVAAQTWSDSSVTFVVPSSVLPGNFNITVQTNAGTKSNSLPFTVLTGKEIPVTFTVNNVPLAAGASVYLTGNVLELGNSAQNTNTAVGPLLAVPSASSSWFINASVPAGAQIQFTFFQVLPAGSIMPEGISHLYGVPNSGVGSTSVSW